MSAWNNWYHCTAHAYGTWLRGDARGWRARHHREHVDGDYKNPPPKGKYDNLYEYSKSLMKRDPVKIANDRRWFVLLAIVHRLLNLGIEVIVASLDGTHLHVLARFPDHNPRHWMGLAKKHASFECRAKFADYTGGLWAKRGHPEPIADREHEVNATGYIVDHGKRGALVWVCEALRRSAAASAITASARKRVACGPVAPTPNRLKTASTR